LFNSTTESVAPVSIFNSVDVAVRTAPPFIVVPVVNALLVKV
jgi:hypothetical protein